MKNEKGFTIVELVIVIAVVAVLAGVLIPMFSTIVKNANISSDTQLVRNMNVILSAESVTKIPNGTDELVALLREGGIERIEPKTRNYTFYWLKNENRIILADNGDLPVYPEEFLYERYDGNNWFDITVSGGGYTPDIEHDFSGDPETFAVNIECNDPSGIVPIDASTLTATEGEQFNLTVKPATAGHCMTKIVVTMEGSIKKTFFRGEIGQPVDVAIEKVTGNISIYVTVKEYCTVTLNAVNPEHLWQNSVMIQAEKGIGFRLERKDIEGEYFGSEDCILRDPYEIVSAKAEDGTDYFVAEDKSITIPTLTGDTVITLDTKIKILELVLTVDGVEVDRVSGIVYGSRYTYTHYYGNRKISGMGVAHKGDFKRGIPHKKYLGDVDLDYRDCKITVTVEEVIANMQIRVILQDSKYQ